MIREDVIKNQEKMCKENKIPMFMPDRGICWRCGGDIAQHLADNGADGSGHVTGCPFCHISFCE